MKKLSAEIKRELENRGLRNLKDGAKFIGVSTEALRLIVNKGHIPRDRTLRVIADKLGLDISALILAAHREKVPAEAKGFFLAPVPAPYREKKRISPLSQEQCEYLSKLMKNGEIQMVRKYRQLTDEGKIQLIGYIDYLFVLHRNGLQLPKPAAQGH